jgi:hypothetical protein
MGYVPVQRDAGQIMYQGAMQRARTLGQTARDITDFLYQKEEENKAFGSKLKSLESLLQTHSDKFGIKEDQLKQFLSVNPNESPKERYLRLGNFIEGSIQAAQLEKINLANRKAQLDLDQMKKLGELYSSFGQDQTQAGGVQGAPSQLQRGTGEMSLMGLTRQAPSGQPAGAQPMMGAQPFDFSMPPASQMAPTSAQVAGGQPQPAPRRFTKVEPAAAEGAPAAAPQATISRPAEEQYDVPPPPVPDWFKQEQPAFGMDLKLSPEAKALAAKLREEYEASQPSEDGREPRRYISATQDTKQPPRKTIKLDAEGIKAILSNPRVLMESFPEVVREYISPAAAQRGFKGQRLDEVMRQEEQLRALQEMMRPSRRRR